MVSPLVSLVLSGLAGFLLGSIPNGFLLARARGIDIRTQGSCNIGATNVLRVCGKGPGYTVFLLDAVKGAAAVLLAGWLTGWRSDHLGQILGGIGALLGHSFTPWLGFKGGKGVATGAGVLLALFTPLVVLVLAIVWLAVFYTTRFVSLASIATALSVPVAVWFLVAQKQAEPGPLMLFSAILTFLVLLRHRTNIQRLCLGTEARFVKKCAKKV